MTLKQYQRAFFLTTAAVGGICGLAWVSKTYWAFAAAILVGSLVLSAVCRRAPEAAADERDREIGGRAANMAVQTFVWIGLAAAALLFVEQKRNPQYAIIAGTLTVSAAALAIYFGVLRDILNRYQPGKWIAAIQGALAFAVIAGALMAVRLADGLP